MASEKSYSSPMLIGLRPGALVRLRGEMTQGELAKRAGVARATVNRLERGEPKSVTFAIINRLAKALECDADLLVSFERESRRGRAR